VFVRERVGPFLIAVGRAWADGEICVRHEHVAAEVVGDVLRLAREHGPSPRRGPLLVLTTLPEERHALGVQMVAVECRAQGVRTRVLGPDTPLEEIASIAREVGADAVGVSVSLATGGVKTDRQLAELRRRLPTDVRLLVGGAGARGVRRGPQGIEYALDWDVLEAWLKDLVDTHRRKARG
jgi:methanogenic corrinoid protein MtbC1